jgi:hypothetical protein
MVINIYYIMDSAEVNGYVFLLFIVWMLSHLIQYIDEQVEFYVKKHVNIQDISNMNIETELNTVHDMLERFAEMWKDDVKDLHKEVCIVNSVATRNSDKILELSSRLFRLKTKLTQSATN